LTQNQAASPPPAGTVLILGGTAEARALAAECVAAAVPVLSSLAGRVSKPALPLGAVRIGGFGGEPGLRSFLQLHRFAAVIDATHPFAATISASAHQACERAGIPLLRLARPGWSDRADAAGWHWVGCTLDAAQAALRLGSLAILTTGRQTLADFALLAPRITVVRVVEPPIEPLPALWQLIRDRGPYTLAGELELLRARAVDVLVTKDSGGAFTAAKLDAAAALDIPVVIIRRPDAVTGMDLVTSVGATMDWLARLSGLGR